MAVLPAGVRPARRRRPPGAGGADGPRRRRRHALRRAPDRPVRPAHRDPRRPALAARDGVPALPRPRRRHAVRRDVLVGAARRAGPARAHAGRVRPPALRAVLLGHDGAAEADRARPRRHPARAPQGPRAAQRRPAGRPLLLVLDHRLDHVELRGLRAARGRHRGVFRRQPRLAGPRRALVDGGGRAAHPVRDLGVVPHALPRGRPAARARPRPRPAPDARLHRLPAAVGGLPLGGGRVRRGGPGELDVGRHRRRERVRRGGPAAAGAGRRDPRADARRRRARLRRGRPRRAGRARRAGDHRADAVDAGRAVG